MVHPGAIEPDSEEATVLRRLMFGDDPDLCQGQQPERMHWRRSSLLLMLHFCARPARSMATLPASSDGRAWRVLSQRPLMEDSGNVFRTAHAWGAYQRNDLLNYCLECLFYAGLQEIDRRPRRPLNW